MREGSRVAASSSLAVSGVAASGLVDLGEVVGAGEIGVAAVVVGGVATVWVVARQWLRQNGQRPARRVRLTALPTETFDPSGEDVERYAAQVARSRQRLKRGRRQALRLRLDSVGDGGCAYRVEGPAHASEVLWAVGYPDVELRPLAEDGLEVATPGWVGSDDGHGDADGGEETSQ